MANRTKKFEKSYNALIEYERAGKSFSPEEIAKEAGWKETTVRTYLSKKWASFIIRESNDRYRVDGLAGQYTLQEYLQLMSQAERIRGLQRELDDKQAALFRSQQVAGLGFMASGLAHEILQPVQAILATAENCRAEAESDGITAPFLTEDLDRIARLAGRIRGLIDHMRLLAREREPQAEALDLAAVVEEVFSLFGQQLKNRGIRVESAFPPGLPPVFMDRVQLEQVFLNLISNAREALEQGAGEDKAIRIEASAPGERVEVVFSDTGRGIAPEHLERLFEPFFTTKEKGAGLGLYIVRDILEASGGSIRADSGEREADSGAGQAGSAGDRGARFILELPIAREGEPE
uniref:histidine kinase n=1 Tax=Candidatus Kentrum sp. DK TaxID=2126562 RepID=A0A450S523_9GAMM|nr:MAG: His Kinase A (phospho-acceptor) domain-containing protein [Candidatus Kentron sp. DK]